jgi:hypothetical protein
MDSKTLEKEILYETEKRSCHNPGQNIHAVFLESLH